MAQKSTELAELVKRLEAVATRLENVQMSGTSQAAGELLRDITILKTNPSSILATAGNLADLNRAVAKLEVISANLGRASDSPAAATPSSAIVGAFEQILQGPLAEFCKLSQKIGGDVAKHGVMVEKVFATQKDFLILASKAKQPSAGDLPSLLKPTSDQIAEIQSFREANRRSEYFNHLSAVSESIPALGWVAVAPAPAPFVKEMNDAGQFYTNRVLKDWKDKSKVHVEWTKSWISTLTELQAFVKENYTTGLTWNPKGVDAKAVAAVPSGGPGGPPPPPPPPPPGFFDDVTSGGDPESKARNALFADLNKGEDVTRGLKKVTDDMKTHKNPGLRDQGKPVPPTSAKPALARTMVAPSKPPKFELDGKKWTVEFQKDNQNLIINETQVNQSVYIYKCEGSTVKINGKVNNIVMDSCKKSAVVFENAVSSCEFINCQSVQMQVMGLVPTISVEKTDGCQMYLSKDAAEKSEIITAKSSEMNVIIPSGNDYIEQPIPEQFKTTVKGTKLNTTISESV